MARHTVPLIILFMVMLFLTGTALAQDHTEEGSGQGRGERQVIEADVDVSMTIHEIAEITGVRGSTLAHDLSLSITVDKDTPLAELGVDQERLDHAIAHALGHDESWISNLKYPIYALIVFFALLYLLWWGIPAGADPKKRKGYYPQWVYILVLAISVIVVGFLLGKSPNPMEAVVKVPKATVGIYESIPPYVVALLFFLVLGLVVNKGVCGWACPFGSLEELIYMLPFFKKAKRWNLPFRISNSIRAILFIAFILLIYGLVADKKGFVHYHYLNPFNLFNFDFSTSTVLPFIVLYLAVSFFFYRPFCRFICPFGFVSWILEKLSLTKVRIDFDRCTDCRACAKACPLTAAADRLDRRSLPTDCFSCMRCLRVCPADAIHYRPAWGPASPKH